MQLDQVQNEGEEPQYQDQQHVCSEQAVLHHTAAPESLATTMFSQEGIALSQGASKDAERPPLSNQPQRLSIVEHFKQQLSGRTTSPPPPTLSGSEETLSIGGGSMKRKGQQQQQQPPVKLTEEVLQQHLQLHGVQPKPWASPPQTKLSSKLRHVSRTQEQRGQQGEEQGRELMEEERQQQGEDQQQLGKRQQQPGGEQQHLEQEQQDEQQQQQQQQQEIDQVQTLLKPFSPGIDAVAAAHPHPTVSKQVSTLSSISKHIRPTVEVLSPPLPAHEQPALPLPPAGTNVIHPQQLLQLRDEQPPDCNATLSQLRQSGHPQNCAQSAQASTKAVTDTEQQPTPLLPPDGMEITDPPPPQQQRPPPSHAAARMQTQPAGHPKEQSQPGETSIKAPHSQQQPILLLPPGTNVTTHPQLQHDHNKRHAQAAHVAAKATTDTHTQQPADHPKECTQQLPASSQADSVHGYVEQGPCQAHAASQGSPVQAGQGTPKAPAATQGSPDRGADQLPSAPVGSSVGPEQGAVQPPSASEGGPVSPASEHSSRSSRSSSRRYQWQQQARPWGSSAAEQSHQQEGLSKGSSKLSLPQQQQLDTQSSKRHRHQQEDIESHGSKITHQLSQMRTTEQPPSRAPSHSMLPPNQSTGSLSAGLAQLSTLLHRHVSSSNLAPSKLQLHEPVGARSVGPGPNDLQSGTLQWHVSSSSLASSKPQPRELADTNGIPLQSGILQPRVSGSSSFEGSSGGPLRPSSSLGRRAEPVHVQPSNVQSHVSDASSVVSLDRHVQPCILQGHAFSNNSSSSKRPSSAHAQQGALQNGAPGSTSSTADIAPPNTTHQQRVPAGPREGQASPLGLVPPSFALAISPAGRGSAAPQSSKEGGAGKTQQGQGTGSLTAEVESKAGGSQKQRDGSSAAASAQSKEGVAPAGISAARHVNGVHASFKKSEGVLLPQAGLARPQAKGAQSGRQQNRTFDEGDPFQVLQESLCVLAEIELLIREALGLPPGAQLSMEDKSVLAKVPPSLLEALEGTIDVVLESKSEVQELVLQRPVKQKPRLLSAKASSGHARGREKATYPVHAQHQQWSPIRQHPASRPLSSGSSDARSMCSRTTQSSRIDTQPLTCSPGPKKAPAFPSRLNVNSFIDGTPSTNTTQSPHLAQRYMYQRVQAQQEEQERNGRAAGLEARAARHQRAASAHHQYSPSSIWMKQKQEQQKERHYRRIYQVQRDLEYIRALREAEVSAEEVHKQVLQKAECSIAVLHSQKAQADTAARWLALEQLMRP